MYQRQADATAFVGPAARAFDTAETLEEVRDFFLGDAGTGITDGELRVGVGLAKCYRDLSMKS